jgi:predicted transcriptional regulator
MDDNSTGLVRPTCAIVAAFVATNSISARELPALIAAVHQALRNTAEPEAADTTPVKPTPAQIRRSITPDALISFEDGRSHLMLKRHLTARGMTLAEYRTKWGLPKDYPTTAPNYSARRSAMAKAIGLGQKAKIAAPAARTRPGTKGTTSVRLPGARKKSPVRRP